MIPKKPEKIIKQVSEDLDLPESMIDDIVSFYYKEVRKTLSSLEHIRIDITGLGHFVIKKGSVSRLTKKYENYMNKYDSQTFTNYHNKKYAESKLEKLKHVKTVIDSSIEEKRTFRNAEKDKKHLG
jgi:nucleoid DNA-binding protein